MTVTVCMPWRATPDRVAAHDTCEKFWRDHGFDVVEADSDPAKPFLCGQARNNAVRQAFTDVVIVADADTLPLNIDQIYVAVEMVKDAYDFVWPFNRYLYVPAWVPEKFGADLPDEDVEVTEVFDSPGGIMVTRQDIFWKLGGYDERFVCGAWGFDDWAFMMAAETLARVGRVTGTVWSFDHVCNRDRSDVNPNKARWRLYQSCSGKPALMRKLLK